MIEISVTLQKVTTKNCVGPIYVCVSDVEDKKNEKDDVLRTGSYMYVCSSPNRSIILPLLRCCCCCDRPTEMFCHNLYK